MDPSTPAERHAPILTSVLWTLLRALLSTAVIGGLALAIFILRHELPWRELDRVAWANRGLMALVFVGLVAWEAWRNRARRLAAEDRGEL